MCTESNDRICVSQGVDNTQGVFADRAGRTQNSDIFLVRNGRPLAGLFHKFSQTQMIVQLTRACQAAKKAEIAEH